MERVNNENEVWKFINKYRRKSANVTNKIKNIYIMGGVFYDTSGGL